MPSLEVSSQRASFMAWASRSSRSWAPGLVRVPLVFHHSLPGFLRMLRTTSNQRSPPSGCAWSGARCPHSVTSRVLPLRSSVGPESLVGFTRRH